MSEKTSESIINDNLLRRSGGRVSLKSASEKAVKPEPAEKSEKQTVEKTEKAKRK